MSSVEQGSNFVIVFIERALSDSCLLWFTDLILCCFGGVRHWLPAAFLTIWCLLLTTIILVVVWISLAWDLLLFAHCTQRLVLFSTRVIIVARVLRWLNRYWVRAGRSWGLRRNFTSLTDYVSVATSRVSALGIRCVYMSKASLCIQIGPCGQLCRLYLLLAC